MREVPLTRGMVALVDDEDYKRVCCYKWCVLRSKHQFYAVRNAPKRDGKGKTILMHRFILGVHPQAMVDHVNRNGLDNQRANLRVCTKSENRANSARAWGASRFRGVSRDRKKWRAQLGTEGGRRFLGLYATEEEAALAYDVAAIREFKEFATPNFPALSPYMVKVLAMEE